MKPNEITIKDLDSKTQKQVDNARLGLDRNNEAYAIQICQAVLERNPGCLPVRKLLRAAQMKSQQAKSKLMNKATGGLAGAMFSMKASGLLKKNPAKAMAAAEEVLSKDTGAAPALKTLAQAASLLGLTETAVFAWESLRDVSPDKPDVLLALGEAYIAVGRSEDAMKLGEKVLRIDPSNGDAHSLIKAASVASSIDKGRWDEDGDYRDKLKSEEESAQMERSSKQVISEDDTSAMIEEMKKRIAEEPDNLKYYQSLVRDLQRAKRFQEAAEWLDKARATPSGQSDVTLEKMASDLRIREVEHQIAEKRKKLAADSGNTALATEITQLEDSLFQTRLSEAEKLVERYPNDMEHRYTYGRLLFEKEAYDDAIKQFQRSQKNPKVRVKSILFMGEAFKHKEQYDFAVEQFQTLKSELVGMNDEKMEVIYELADSYEKMGQMDKAVAEYKLIYANDIGYRDVADKINASYTKKSEPED